MVFPLLFSIIVNVKLPAVYMTSFMMYFRETMYNFYDGKIFGLENYYVNSTSKPIPLYLNYRFLLTNVLNTEVIEKFYRFNYVKKSSFLCFIPSSSEL